MKLLQSIDLGSLAPDLPALAHGKEAGGERAVNVMPRSISYGPLPDFEPITSDALAGRCLGAISITDDANDSTVTYAGDATTLYAQTGSSFTEVGSGYSAVRWEFIEWGADCIAATIGHRPQVRTTGGVADFADLTTEDVQGAHIAIWRNQVVLGDVIDADGHNSSRLRWSGFNRPDLWAINPVTLADFQDLRGEHGPIQRLVSGTEGLVFQHRGIWGSAFVGAPYGFRLDLLESQIGCVAAGSVIRYGDHTFFLSDDGFRAISPGSKSQGIGDERIDRTVLRDFDLSYANSMSAAVFEREQVIVWSYPGQSASNGLADTLLMFNASTNKWGFGEQIAEFLFTHIAANDQNIDNIDGLDTKGEGVESPVYGIVDDRRYIDTTRQLGAFDGDHQLGSMSGPAKPALFQTAEYQHHPGRKTFINYIRPLIDGGVGVRAYIGQRNSQSDPQVFTPSTLPLGVPVNSDGVCPLRAAARYQSYVVEVEGGFADALGVNVYGQPLGRR